MFLSYKCIGVWVCVYVCQSDILWLEWFTPLLSPPPVPEPSSPSCSCSSDGVFQHVRSYHPGQSGAGVTTTTDNSEEEILQRRSFWSNGCQMEMPYPTVCRPRPDIVYSFIPIIISIIFKMIPDILSPWDSMDIMTELSVCSSDPWQSPRTRSTLVSWWGRTGVSVASTSRSLTGASNRDWRVHTW